MFCVNDELVALDWKQVENMIVLKNIMLLKQDL